jgi:CPA1 family monovalent cation:H+ antiporter
MALQLVLSAGGGILCGAAIAGAMLLLAGRTQDHLVEITFTTVAAYGSFLVSRETACVRRASRRSPRESCSAISDRWGDHFARSRSRGGVLGIRAFASNSFVFLLIGMREAHQNFFSDWRVVLLAIALVTLGALPPSIRAVRCSHDPPTGCPRGISTFCSGADCAER